MFDFVPKVTRTLIFINVIVFFLQTILTSALPIEWFALWPASVPPGYVGYPRFEPWQVITYAFLHGGVNHLFLNMLGLYMFGSDVERVFGEKRFLQIYFSSVITAALFQMIFYSLMGGEPSPTIGASGGVFGLLLTYALCFPKRTVMLLIPPIPMPAWLFATLYGAIELFQGIAGTQSGVAHFAHLGGMLGAWLFLKYWRRR
ncbi:MAG: rhomboid family intramembrane serine protease [Betaproteobacteria bacterium]|nr:rhomboid family intramembrane serine protease [Betaproteobacteria bacterium]MDE2422753.1 rhomboid family intramembrane serine protease [Betaproteobacteria bacterium]